MLLKQTLSVSTDRAGEMWHAELFLTGAGGVYQAQGYHLTQSRAIAEACKQARGKLGALYVPSTAERNAEFRAWCEALDALAKIHE